MSATYHVYSDLNLLYVRYAGHFTTRQTEDLLPYYELDPEVVPGLRCLVDCQRLTSAKVDFQMRRVQMERVLTSLKRPDTDFIVAYYCPTSVSQSLSTMQHRMWEGHQGVVFHTVDTVARLSRALKLPVQILNDILTKAL